MERKRRESGEQAERGGELAPASRGIVPARGRCLRCRRGRRALRQVREAGRHPAVTLADAGLASWPAFMLACLRGLPSLTTVPLVVQSRLAIGSILQVSAGDITPLSCPV